MILADNQIKKLCTLPTFVITEMVPSHQIPGSGLFYVPRENIRFTHDNEENIKKYDRPSMANGGVGLVSYRPLTQEEKDNYPLMISPFVDHQVRTVKRKPTEEETRIWNISRDCSEIKVPDNWSCTDPDIGLEIEEKIISMGLSSYGYDITLADEFKIFSNINSTIIDPLNFKDDTYVDFKGPVCILPPNSYLLGRSKERFNLPNDVSFICLSKSTYARSGCIINATVGEAGWKGELVIEAANSTSLPMKIYANQGIAQLLFFKGEVPCDVSYADRNGKYMNQTGITLPKV